MALVLASVIVFTIVVLLIPYIKAELRDIDPVVLTQQTSLSETRKEGESAIHRSVDVPHGSSLTGGLRIQINYKVRDGTLKDIWHCALNNGANGGSKMQWGSLSYTTKQVNWILHEISSFLAKNLQLEIEKQESGIKYKKVAVCVRDLFSNPQALLFILSAFFVNELSIVNLTGAIKDLPNDIDTVLVDEFTVGYIKKLGVKNIIIISEAQSDNKCILFDDIVNITSGDVPELEKYDYQPATDYTIFNNQPYSEIVNGSELKFYQRNFVASIASKLMSLQSEYQWNESDSLAIIGDPDFTQNRNLIHTTLCGLLSNVAKIQFGNNSRINSLEKLAELKPTIVSIDPVGLSQLTRSGKKHIKKSFVLQRAEYLNSMGIFSSFGKLEKKLNLKLVYVSQYSQIVSSASTNLAKSVMGARIIREIYLHGSMGPVLKTNVLDYRITQYGSYQLMGVPVNSMEAKVKFVKEGDKVGSLFMRGMSLAKGDLLTADDEYWFDTGIKGLFAQDGCFYGSF